MNTKPTGRVAQVVRMLALLFAAACIVRAQTAASLTGRVTDPSNAVIPGVAITLTNTATEIANTTTTNGDGYYFVPFLPPGAYRVRLEGMGFKVLTQSGIVLEVAQVARLDFHLDVGDLTQSVQVESTIALLNVGNATVGQVIDNKQIVDLPLNGRNFTQLATLVPGATSLSASGSVNTPNLSINGGRGSSTVFMVDGMSMSEQFYDGAALQPSIDAIQEFNVQTNALSAEYGQGNAVVNVQLKSGGNEYHGSAFEFLRNQVLDARNFFQTAKVPLRFNQFGGTFGGPLTIPRILKGKNSNFFFVDYQGSRSRTPVTSNTTDATQDMRNGNFSGLSAIIDPTTKTPFPNNQIPASRLSPQAQYFLPFMPLPNSGVFPRQTYLYTAASQTQVDQFDIHTDHRLSGSDNLSLSYSLQGMNQYSPGATPLNGGLGNFLLTQAVRLHEVHTISPTTFNEVHAGYLRLTVYNSPQGLGTNHTVLSGIGGFNQTSAEMPGFPQISISGYLGINGSAWNPFHRKDNKYDLGDTLMTVKGAHTLKFGADGRHFSSVGDGAAYARGNFSVTNQYTQNAFSDFMLGLPSSGSRTFPRNWMGIGLARNYSFFAQDDWKVSSRVTLNLGVRYELNFLPQILNNTAASYDLNTGKIVVATNPDGQINLTAQQVTQFVYPLYSNLIVTDKSVGLDSTLRHMDRHDWAPRVGLAAQVARNTVLRAGYGWFYVLSNSNQTSSTLAVNPPFIADELGYSNTVPSPTSTLATMFADPTQQYKLGYLAIHAIDPRAVTPYLQEWNVSLQHLIRGLLSVESAYVGSKGTHLDNAHSFNVPLPGPGTIQTRRPNPVFGVGSIVDNSSYSTYNALQAKAQIKNWKGFSLLASYAFAKSIDDISSNAQSGGLMDPNNLTLNRGVSDFDVKHRFVSSINYTLPFGRGKKTLLARTLGNWDIGSIVTLQSGIPFTPSIQTNLLNNGMTNRANRTGSGQVDGRTLARDFDPLAFSVPAAYMYGTSGRNILYTRGSANLDAMIKRNFAITERLKLQARGEFFNLTNTPHFSGPVADIQSVNAGRILSAGSPRDIQLAVKLTF